MDENKIGIERQGANTLFSINGTEIAILCGREDAEDIITMEGGTICIERHTKSRVADMVMEIRTLFKNVHTLIPAVSYDGNPWGSDHEYKGLEYEGVPYTYAYHRTSVPGASASEGEKYSAAVYAIGNLSGSMHIDDGYAVHRIIWPETEGPRVLMSDGWADAYYGTMKAADTFRAWLFVGDGKQNIAWRQMLSHAFNREYRKLSMARKAKEVWELQAAYAKLLFTEGFDGFKGFSIGFKRYDDRWKKVENNQYEIGWCGQNASLAVSLLYNFKMTGDSECKEMALTVLESWLHKARTEDGFLMTRYGSEAKLIDACNLGTAGCQFFDAFDMMNDLNMDGREYYNAAIEVCDFAVARQRPDGGIGMSWNYDGTLHEFEGTAGAFLILPLAEAYKRAGNKVYGIAAEKAYEFYYHEFYRNGYGTSGALDTKCTDKESVIPLLKGGILLYEVTKNSEYLNKAADAAWYLSGWQWHQSVKFPKESALYELNYDTFGGTAVSTAHLHMDDFALCYVAELMKLSEYTGNEEWKERAIAIWYNAVQGISDGTLSVYGSAKRPQGSSDEGFHHTRWGEREYKRGMGQPYGVSEWLVAWPGAFRLEVLRKCSDWNLFG
ncbi:hypothetical protein [Novisyntrophococcus fermenticellae]|uniref:hypothetical protein n=1 Tax=Novisyntrophococcus fermenticellae TaxID=2068655 RepID=UPI001E2FFD8C|nr:hypothetical protein [Novisyntrophococcus fermenticellae]